MISCAKSFREQIAFTNPIKLDQRFFFSNFYLQTPNCQRWKTHFYYFSDPRFYFWIWCSQPRARILCSFWTPHQFCQYFIAYVKRIQIISSPLLYFVQCRLCFKRIFDETETQRAITPYYETDEQMQNNELVRRLMVVCIWTSICVWIDWQLKMCGDGGRTPPGNVRVKFQTGASSCSMIWKFTGMKIHSNKYSTNILDWKFDRKRQWCSLIISIQSVMIILV